MGKYLKKFETHAEYEEYINDYSIESGETFLQGFNTLGNTYRDAEHLVDGGMPKITSEHMDLHLKVKKNWNDWDYDGAMMIVEFDSQNEGWDTWWSSVEDTCQNFEIVSEEGEYFEFIMHSVWGPEEPGNYVVYYPTNGDPYVNEMIYQVIPDFYVYNETVTANFPIPNVSICMDEMTDINHVHYMPKFKKPSPISPLTPIEVCDGLYIADMNIGAGDEFDPGLFYKFAGMTGYSSFEEGNAAETPYYDSETGEFTKYTGDEDYLEEMDDVCGTLPPVEIDGEVYYWRMPCGDDLNTLFYCISSIEYVEDDEGRTAMLIYFNNGNSVMIPCCLNPESTRALFDEGATELMLSTTGEGEGETYVGFLAQGSGIWIERTSESRHLVFPVRPILDKNIEPE